MQRDTTIPPVRGPVLTIDGYGASLTVQRGHLVVRDGHAASGEQRERRIPRGRCSVNRIIVRAPAGSVTIAAIDWCHRLGIPIAFLGSDSRLMGAWVSSALSDAPLKRAQAVAGVTEDGAQIARSLLRDKLESQVESIETSFRHLGVLAKRDDRARYTVQEIRSCIGRLPLTLELRGLLILEGYAARLYWQLLSGTPLPWPPWTHSRVPQHWLCISARELGAVQQVRDATDPFNAILNYAYTLLEVETRIAIAANGLDPDLGLLHVDTRARESLVYDLMEPMRTRVDVLCLEFCRREGLRPHMFHELREGVVRLDPDVCRQLAEWIMPQLRRSTAGAASAFAARLRKVRVPYRLSIRERVALPAIKSTADFGACGYCGTPLRREGRKFCSRQCTLQRDTQVRKPIELAQAKLAAMKAAGHDPGHGGEAARKRGAKIAESNRRRARLITADDKRQANNDAARRYRERKKAADLARNPGRGDGPRV
jgi:CRISPR-associated protein Cas1